MPRQPVAVVHRFLFNVKSIKKPRLARFFYVDFQALATVYMVMLALVLSNILSAEAATKP